MALVLALSTSTSASASNVTGTSASASARSASARASTSSAGANTSTSIATGIGTNTLHSFVYTIREVVIAILLCPFHCCCPHAAPGPYFFLGRWGVGFADEAYKGLVRPLRTL